MFNNKTFKIPRFISIFLVIILTAAVCVFFIFDITVFAIDRFSPYNLSCKITSRNIFGGLELENVRFGSKTRSSFGAGSFEISAQNVKLKLEEMSIFFQRKIVLDCLLEQTLFEGAAGDVLSAGTSDVLAASFDGAREYRKIKFKFLLNEKFVEISGFNAESKDIKVSGDYAYFKRQKNVRMDVKVAFSPEVFGTFEGDFIKENMLSIDSDGWYSTIIEYKGNPELLKAISTVIIPVNSTTLNCTS